MRLTLFPTNSTSEPLPHLHPVLSPLGNQTTLWRYGLPSQNRNREILQLEHQVSDLVNARQPSLWPYPTRRDGFGRGRVGLVTLTIVNLVVAKQPHSGTDQRIDQKDSVQVWSKCDTLCYNK